MASWRLVSRSSAGVLTRDAPHHAGRASEASAAAGLPYCLHWRALEKNSPMPRIKTSSRQLASCRGAGENFCMPRTLWPGISSYQQVTEVSYGLAARGANLLQRSESTCFSGLTAEQNPYESGICSRAAFK